MARRVLVTGGAGFIGSHVVASLVHDGYKVGIVDDLRNSRLDVVNRIMDITGPGVDFFKTDVLIAEDIFKVLDEFRPNLVIQLAADKSPSESIANPMKYYRNNITGLCNVLASMEAVGCNKLVFSSSATVYGVPPSLPITEKMPTAPTNPYGRSKLFGEALIKDWCDCSAARGAVALRYFNPAGAHPSGLIGEDPERAENIFPNIFQSIRNGAPFEIYGDDYSTRDGTGERDFIHVVDLANAHTTVAAGLNEDAGYGVFNVGTGVGTTVLELISKISMVLGADIPTKIVSRRPGDVASAFADATRINEVYGWTAKHNLEAMCRDSWSWFSSH